MTNTLASTLKKESPVATNSNAKPKTLNDLIKEDKPAPNHNAQNTKPSVRYEMPTVPKGFFWRVRVTESTMWGTLYEVSLMQRLRFSSKMIDRISSPANEYAKHYLGPDMEDEECLARLAATVWEASGASVQRRAHYQSRARIMRSYAGVYDAKRTLYGKEK
jgi:hypothetical protein